MSTVQDLVNQLNTSSGNVQWHLVGSGTPIEETQVTTVADPLGIKPPQTVNRGTGKYYVVVQDNGNPPNQRAMMLIADPNSQALQAPSVHQGGTTGSGKLVVRQTGVNDQDVDAAGKVTPRTNVYTGDLNKIDWNAGGPLQDIPQGSTTKQPSATANMDRIGPDGKVIPPEDTTTRPVAVRDPATGTTVAIPAGDKPAPVTMPDGSLGSFDPATNKVTILAQADAKNPGTPVHGGDGKWYIWDPKANGGKGAMVDSGVPGTATQLLGTEPTSKQIYAVDGQGNEIPGSRRDNPNYVEPGKATSLQGTDTNSQYIYAVDKDGNEIPGSRRLNPNYNAPKPTELNTDTISAVRGLLQPDGTVKWVKNDQQLTVNQAMADLMNQAGMKVTAGSMSMDDAKNMLTGAINLMNAHTSQQTNAITNANNMLQGANQAAQTGAGMLQNRVTAATNTLQSLATAPIGHMMSAPSGGTGASLVGGLQDWVTDLGGGQGTYDAAAHMVQQADPTNQSGVAGQAYSQIRAMMDQYKQQTGRDWTPPGSPDRQFNAPTTADAGQTNVTPNPAVTAANQTNASGFNPQASTSALNAMGVLDNPAGRALAAGQSSVPGAPPIIPGQYNPIFQQATRSAVGQPATGPVVGSGTFSPLPFIPGSGGWVAPVTV